MIDQFPKIIDSDEKADSILKAGFKDAENIVNLTKSEVGLKNLIDAVGSEEVAQQLIGTAKGVSQKEDLDNLYKPQKHWQH